ncbi:MAG: PAS domain-containing sensor histidine kinase [Desulfovibrionaceae bacterium]|jgi:PAS domain S-box-containing protein|nr:PAS domain-containing sensor histidine kinase [Desulfovibrionaceae bacterium]
MPPIQNVPIRDSIAARLLLRVFLVYLGIAAVLTLAHLAAEYQNRKAAITQGLESVAKTIAPGLATAVYNVDREQVRSFLTGLMDCADVTGVRITTRYQGVFEAGAPPATGPSGAAPSADAPLVDLETDGNGPGGQGGTFWFSMPVFHPVAGERVPMARITLFSDSSVILGKVWPGLLFILANFVISSAALWAIFLWFSRRMLARPLAALTAAAARAHLDNLEGAHVDVQTTGRNELKVLEESFNAMLARLRRSQGELRRAESKYRAIFENALEGIFRSSVDGRFLDVNPALARILGYDSPAQVLAEVTDVSTQVYVQPEERKEMLALLRRRRQVVGFEMASRRRDGRIIWVSFSARLVSEEGADYVEGSIEDITGRRTVAEALRQAKETAETASRMKSEFLSLVSHELRTPMTSVLGFAKLMDKKLRSAVLPRLDDPAAERAARQILENLGIVIEEGQRLTGLINDLLDLTRLEAGKVEWRMSPVHLGEILDRALAATRVLAEERGLRLRAEVDGHLPAVLGDADRLVQVCINLISNAVKFTDTGSIICRTQRDDGRILVSVADTGVGIAPENLALVFDKFRQLGDVMTDRPQGSGLGLAICKEIVESHGGRIWADAIPGKGSVFTFSLPAIADVPGEN